MTMLKGFSALDMTDEKGLFCGKILSDLGVEVIKVEKPGGDMARNIGPFYQSRSHPKESLYWFAYNTNKKSITLDINKPKGVAIFKKLAEKVDFIIESFSPGELDSLGIGYQDINKINPKIVYTSISPFGQAGPWRDYKTSDLIAMASSGYLYLCGDPDRAPVRISFPQAYLIAGSEAAAASLIAHYYRETSGEGQLVDVSIQHAVSLIITNAIPFWELNKVILKRSGQFRVGLSQEKIKQRQVWQCKDGWVLYLITGGAMRAKAQHSLMQWINEEGLADEALMACDWNKVDMSIVSQDFIDKIEGCLINFFQSHTKMELQEGGLKRRIDLYAVYTVKDIAESKQLEARNFWQTVEYPELGISIRHPGSFVKASETPLCLLRRAPLVGENNVEVYSGWLGMTSNEILLLKQSGTI